MFAGVFLTIAVPGAGVSSPTTQEGLGEVLPAMVAFS
jgi:hypothetical protein